MSFVAVADSARALVTHFFVIFYNLIFNCC